MKIDWANKLDGKTIKREWKEGDDDTIWTKERKKLFCPQSSTDHAVVAIE
jgi:hypothetical protein